MELKETRLSGEYKFHGRVVTLRVDRVALPNGNTAAREVIEHPGGVCVAALTEENELLFVRQFRYATGEILTELPAGKLEPGEDPFEAMKREQMEETGTWAERYVPLGGIYASPGYCNEQVRLWACRISGSCGEQHLDPDEFVEVVRIPLDRAMELAMEGRLPDAKTQVGVLRTAMLVKEGKL